MEEKKDQNKVSDAYQDFLSEISNQSSRKNEKGDFLDSIGASSLKRISKSMWVSASRR